ncbi:UNVERIFIED_CONTAM: hypothetical protein Slati_2199000 [Sesamum latifolium]|uniref:Uncharacterized protein n=1 Tax=Sesamum latifolium TaxID=2727402 RepID=A0AAW2WT93_9LAMI
MTFLEVILGTRLSLTWSSILEAKDLLSSGCHWCIGSGRRIRIWGDRDASEEFKPMSPPVVFSQEAVVEDLINGHIGRWKMELITQMFCIKETRVILDIPLGRMDEPDTRVWHYSRDGGFSIKSTYVLELERRALIEASVLDAMGVDMLLAREF